VVIGALTFQVDELYVRGESKQTFNAATHMGSDDLLEGLYIILVAEGSSQIGKVHTCLRLEIGNQSLRSDPDPVENCMVDHIGVVLVQVLSMH
jgi:hypothetical protein